MRKEPLYVHVDATFIVPECHRISIYDVIWYNTQKFLVTIPKVFSRPKVQKSVYSSVRKLTVVQAIDTANNVIEPFMVAT